MFLFQLIPVPHPHHRAATEFRTCGVVIGVGHHIVDSDSVHAINIARSGGALKEKGI